VHHAFFISYHHSDKALADRMCTTFEANGIRSWIAPRDVEPGKEWAESIVEAIGKRQGVATRLFSSVERLAAGEAVDRTNGSPRRTDRPRKDRASTTQDDVVFPWTGSLA
jgi:TIR domain